MLIPVFSVEVSVSVWCRMNFFFPVNLLSMSYTGISNNLSVIYNIVID